MATRINAGSSAFPVLAELIERFVADAKAAGVTPIILIFPDQNSLESLIAGGRGVSEPIFALCEQKHFVCLDAAQPLGARGRPFDRYFMPAMHLSAEANRIVAEWLGPKLRAHETARAASP
jgi:hypothetical protein